MYSAGLTKGPSCLLKLPVQTKVQKQNAANFPPSPARRIHAYAAGASDPDPPTCILLLSVRLLVRSPLRISSPVMGELGGLPLLAHVENHSRIA